MGRSGALFAIAVIAVFPSVSSPQVHRDRTAREHPTHSIVLTQWGDPGRDARDTSALAPGDGGAAGQDRAGVGGGTFDASNAVGLGYELVIVVLLVASFAGGLAFVLWVRPGKRPFA